MSGRPFIEFIQSQQLRWERSARWPGAGIKSLSGDPDSDASTALLRLPPGWSGVVVEPGMAAELFLLEGTATADRLALAKHHYAYLPSGASIDAGAAGTTLLVYCDPRPSGDAPDPPIALDTIALPWDRSGLEPEIGHLNYARKNLRLAPDGGRRTYLLGGMPHGHPAHGARMERHPHAEEMFLIAGDMPCSLGVMRAGAYFYRPPDIWHGLDCTIGGFLLLMRTPGSNVTISEWSGDLQPVSIEPPYRPELPAALASLATAPLPPATDY